MADWWEGGGGIRCVLPAGVREGVHAWMRGLHKPDRDALLDAVKRKKVTQSLPATHAAACRHLNDLASRLGYPAPWSEDVRHPSWIDRPSEALFFREDSARRCGR